MNIAYEPREEAVHRLAPNLQSLARKERYSVTLKGRPLLAPWSNMGPARTTELPPTATQRAVNHSAPEASGLEAGRDPQAFGGTAELK